MRADLTVLQRIADAFGEFGTPKEADNIRAAIAELSANRAAGVGVNVGAEIERLRRELEEAEAYAKEVGTALVKLTPDGSEFYRRAGERFRVDAKACVAYIVENREARQRTIARLMRQLKADVGVNVGVSAPSVEPTA